MNLKSWNLIHWPSIKVKQNYHETLRFFKRLQMWLWFNQKRELCTLLWLYEIGVTQYSIRCPLPNQAFKQMCFAQCFSQKSPLLIVCRSVISSYRETLQQWINRCSWVNRQFGWMIQVSGDISPTGFWYAQGVLPVLHTYAIEPILRYIPYLSIPFRFYPWLVCLHSCASYGR